MADSLMLPQRPDAWPEEFARCLDAGDLDGVLSLYEPGARFVVPPSGQVTSRKGLRSAVAGLIAKHAHMHGRVVRSVVVDDIAVLYTDFEGTVDGRSGDKVEVRSLAIEVLCCQPDGSWKLIVGDPAERQARRRALGERSPRTRERGA